ncbi:granulin-2-like isoform X1 [Xenia sp. Carnegie-2017]|uniref:granulin-2-like isoform X1 n=1 Tax=Xenia sp. Carnegie-2017 TaxID=2897299 RepID=UPI001F03B1AD|nr:granulin-2-like isoform X1 [Xenia sp. Carnegie-2017]
MKSFLFIVIIVAVNISLGNAYFQRIKGVTTEISLNGSDKNLKMIRCSRREYCEDYQTCCRYRQGAHGYMCCPVRYAQCCDGGYCCPRPYTCSPVIGECQIPVPHAMNY